MSNDFYIYDLVMKSISEEEIKNDTEYTEYKINLIVMSRWLYDNFKSDCESIFTMYQDDKRKLLRRL